MRLRTLLPAGSRMIYIRREYPHTSLPTVPDQLLHLTCVGRAWTYEIFWSMWAGHLLMFFIGFTIKPAVHKTELVFSWSTGSVVPWLWCLRRVLSPASKVPLRKVFSSMKACCDIALKIKWDLPVRRSLILFLRTVSCNAKHSAALQLTVHRINIKLRLTGKSRLNFNFTRQSIIFVHSCQILLILLSLPV